MTGKMTEKEMMDLSGLSAKELEEACKAHDEAEDHYDVAHPDREPREVALEAFAMQRAKEEAEKGRVFTLVVIELDHTDGHVANVVYGDLHLASKVCRHLSHDLAMRTIKMMAAEMGISIDNEKPA